MIHVRANGDLESRAFPAARLRERFLTRGYVRIPGFFDERLVRRIRRELGGRRFIRARYREVGNDLCLRDDRISGWLLFLLSGDELFRWVEAVTGCGPLRRFTGRLYQSLPRSGHRLHWHDDCAHGRQAAITINLSPDRYRGGMLELRRKKERDGLARLANPGPGDAILFRVSREWEHCVTAVEGNRPKMALAGWFQAQPSFEDRGGENV